MVDDAVAAPISADEQRLRAATSLDVSTVDEAAFLAVLDDALAAIEAKGLSYVLMGGIASACLGRPRWTHDIDLLVRPSDASLVIEALAGADFATEKTFPDWLFKASRDGQLVDVIFRSAGDIYLDDEMVARARRRDFMGRQVLIVPPEDLIVIKAIVSDEHMPRHWHDALGVLGCCLDLDWDYLLFRARKGARRVLSLLLYAQSCDLVVPWPVVRTLFEILDDPGAGRQAP